MVPNNRVLDPHSGDDDMPKNPLERNLPYLKPLKTVQELRAGDALIEVHVSKIPAKAARTVSE